MRRAIAAVVLATLSVTACLGPSGTLFQTTVTQPDGSNSMPVTLHDHTGLVTAIEPALGDFAVGNDPLVAPAPNDPSSVVVSWIGGLCDNDVALSFRQAEGTHFLFLEVHGKLGLGCPAAGVLRGLQIRFSEPMSVDTIQARISK
jgi:hypothetical protein